MQFIQLSFLTNRMDAHQFHYITLHLIHRLYQQLLLTALWVWLLICNHFERSMFAGLEMQLIPIPTWRAIWRWKALHLNFLFHPSDLNNRPRVKKIWPVSQRDSFEELHLISVQVWLTERPKIRTREFARRDWCDYQLRQFSM